MSEPHKQYHPGNKRAILYLRDEKLEKWQHIFKYRCVGLCTVIDGQIIKELWGSQVF